MTRPSSRPASATRAGRQRAQALHTLQQQQSQQDPITAPELLQQIKNHLDQQRHALTTAQLIDLIITTYPTCPKFASLLVDRLMAGDEALAEALRSEDRI